MAFRLEAVTLIAVEAPAASVLVVGLMLSQLPPLPTEIEADHVPGITLQLVTVIVCEPGGSLNPATPEKLSEAGEAVTQGGAGETMNDTFRRCELLPGCPLKVMVAL